MKGLVAAEKERSKMEDNVPVHVTDADFDDVIHGHPLALIDGWAPWCGPCRAIAPTIEEIAKEYADKLFVGKLNVDDNPKTAECYQIQSIPTLLLVKDGCEVDRIVGLCPKEHITQKLQKHLK
jgi:thioredoxin